VSALTEGERREEKRRGFEQKAAKESKI